MLIFDHPTRSYRCLRAEWAVDNDSNINNNNKTFARRPLCLQASSVPSVPSVSPWGVGDTTSEGRRVDKLARC